MAKQATEEENNIRRRARRRLIGAIALALAVVVILPMMLDSEPKSTEQNIDLRIPASDKAGEFVPGVAISDVLDAPTVSEVEPVTVASSAVAAVNSVPHENAALPSASGKINLADSTAVAEAPADIQAANAAATAKHAPAKSVAEAKPAAAKPAEVSQSESRHAEVTKPEEKPVAKSSVSYIVQVGAFSNAATATKEAARLKEWGFKAYTELVSGTTRVRVGPYTEQSKADKVRSLLEKHDLHPVVTEIK